MSSQRKQHLCAVGKRCHNKGSDCSRYHNHNYCFHALQKLMFNKGQGCMRTETCTAEHPTGAELAAKFGNRELEQYHSEVQPEQATINATMQQVATDEKTFAALIGKLYLSQNSKQDGTFAEVVSEYERLLKEIREVQEILTKKQAKAATIADLIKKHDPQPAN